MPVRLLPVLTRFCLFQHLSAAGVVRAVQVFQSGLGDVSIDLRGTQVCMAKHHLHGPEIRTVIEQVGCESMSERMG